MALDEKGLMSLVVGHRVGIERLSKRVIRDVIKLLEAADADIAAQIAAQIALGSGVPERTQRLRKALGGVLAEAHKAFRGELTRQLTDAAVYEADWSRRLYEGLDIPLNVRFDFLTPSRHQLRSLVTSRPFRGAVLREWARGIEADTRRKLMQQLRIGMLEGENLDSIIRRTNRGSAAKTQTRGSHGAHGDQPCFQRGAPGVRKGKPASIRQSTLGFGSGSPHVAGMQGKSGEDLPDRQWVRDRRPIGNAEVQ